MGCLKLTYYPENHLEDTLYARQNRVWEVYIREEYTPWGETSFGSYGKKKYRFNGKELDSESSLYAYGARYYSPWMCRFVQVDPQAGKYMQQSSYVYADNSPVCKMDINGEGTGDDGGGGDSGGGTSSASPVNVPSTSGTENKKDKNSNTANITDFVSPERVKQFQESVKNNSTSLPSAQTGLNIANPATQMGTDLKTSVQVNKKIPLASPRAVNTEKASFHVSNKGTSANPTGNTEKTGTSNEKFRDWVGIITYGQHNKGESNVTAKHTTWMESTLMEMLELFTKNPKFSRADTPTEAIKEAAETVDKALEQAGKEGYIKYDYSDKPGENKENKIDTIPNGPIMHYQDKYGFGKGELQKPVIIKDKKGNLRKDTIKTVY